jgi:hypothetical protein
MDLIALVTTDQQVLIYRLNGQRVYGATQKSEQLRVASIQWKPNGLYPGVPVPIVFKSNQANAAHQDNSLPLPGVMGLSGS